MVSKSSGQGLVLGKEKKKGVAGVKCGDRENLQKKQNQKFQTRRKIVGTCELCRPPTIVQSAPPGPRSASPVCIFPQPILLYRPPLAAHHARCPQTRHSRPSRSEHGHAGCHACAAGLSQRQQHCSERALERSSPGLSQHRYAAFTHRPAAAQL